MDDCLEVDSVVKNFSEKTILSDVYLCCKPGDIIGLFGLNGTGKSTLLKIIFGTLKADRSFIRINGQVQTRPAYLSGLVAYLPQHNYLPHNLTITELVHLYLPKEQVNNFLGDRFLFKYRKSKVKTLSGGEQRYLEIKLLLYHTAPYVLLDEPFNGLYPLAAEAIREHITIASQTKGIILTDHNFREVHKAVNRLLLLSDCHLREVSDADALSAYGYASNPR
ncbi:ABC-type multidrug transport system ATPase subunit [Parabacteroides sp. PF5-5]|uniref:ATP-binding cassette domain-containing protein n=1 Tax=unclassified Parabacteroides TaxID=2649774 RepID=UPI002473C31C|nr:MULTISPECIES: ATP-binding cassette domain-containing protein [unclassified Parabacteroides]MDH6304957.1 ABC-type multidrug transport system ATPase subunit [Parabacteroides sp. PH5-39]MDH6315957.1 ABC-type multidrug transport system ATPase subunit [Parabacteroides sp. PF5-13]MDH6319614.1 ABC-type multidrug transport system ATPase subunit [Parabacteroides sp. PH5-13]MDH6323345.1 ABC-type multidrug transport system ATPase subunit [Parabacteroides sp. PH5-8]MDH6327146.1 ABC-type multidrug trans